MANLPIIFEDHAAARFRPLAWSTPCYEVRCGMFNTRERIAMACADRGVDEAKLGGLLPRSLLAPLHGVPDWSVGGEQVASAITNSDRCLWLSGRLAPDHDLLAGLLAEADALKDFAWLDEQGLLAASLSTEVSLRLLAAWQEWEQQAAAVGCWRRPDLTVQPWDPTQILEFLPLQDGLGDSRVLAADAGLAARLPRLVAVGEKPSLDWIWDIVPATAQALRGDLVAVSGGRNFRRTLFGISPEPSAPAPAWAQTTRLDPATQLAPRWLASVPIQGDPADLWLADGVWIAPGTSIDTRRGPVILDRDVQVAPHCLLEGPLYVGAGSSIKAGARIYGETSLGAVNRVAGEIGESTFGDYANKQHDGFIGHGVLGSWINLGATTTCSDLKNNYGKIRVDLGWGELATDKQFVGLLLGDHAKTAIGTLFNTGTTVGFATNIFGPEMPPKYVGNFRWGGQSDGPAYATDRAIETAEVVMSRRGCVFGDEHRQLFMALSD